MGSNLVIKIFFIIISEGNYINILIHEVKHNLSIITLTFKGNYSYIMHVHINRFFNNLHFIKIIK